MPIGDSRERKPDLQRRQQGDVPLPFLVPGFSTGEKAGLYRAIVERRDIRRFRSEPLPAAALAQILRAAHHAPSVGFMQPWDFLLIQDRGIREQVHAAFQSANAEALDQFTE